MITHGVLTVNNESGQKIYEQNLDLVYSLFFSHEYLSKPQVVELTNLSIPTVTNHIKTLEESNMITQVKLLSSRGGRPPVAYGLVSDYKVAIGVDVTEERVKIGLVDLKGRITVKHEYPFTPNHLQEQLTYLSTCIKDFIETNTIDKDKILGVGLSMQAVVANGGQEIIYSKISPLENLNADKLSAELKLPVRFFHDVECAALSELWFCANLSNACYVSLSEHIGGSLIKHHKIEHGKNGYAGALEHLCIVPGGLPCYCGHQGCLEAYCSLSALAQQCTQANLSVEQMFELVHLNQNKTPEVPQVQEPNPETKDLTTACEIWEQYLKHFAQALYVVYLLLERDIVIGGKMAARFSEKDIQHLEELIIAQGTFSIQPGFIRVAQVLKNAALNGAALYFIASSLPEIVVPVKI